MVKILDEKFDELPDHVGWRLWQANKAWQREFVSAMREAGHDWFTEARAGLLGHVARTGTRQSALMERMAVSKQAVQQLLDGLEQEGVLERRPDPRDGRGKLVCYTAKGLSALLDGDRVKQEIETGWIRHIGERRFSGLMEALRILNAMKDNDPSAGSA